MYNKFPLPRRWAPVTERQFAGILRATNWIRDSQYVDGLVYRHMHNREDFAFKSDDGPIMVDPAVFDAHD